MIRKSQINWGTIALAILIMLIILIVLGWYLGVIPFMLGTAYGLVIVNLVYYLAIFFASFIASYLIRRAFGPAIDRAVSRIKELFKRKP